MRASAGDLAVHGALILAGGHVRASAGALAVHGALIPCVCETTSHGLVLRVHACMEVNETGHAQHLNMLKQRPRKWFFREVDFLASLAFVVGHTIAIYR